jgi:hypothetical protein
MDAWLVLKFNMFLLNTSGIPSVELGKRAGFTHYMFLLNTRVVPVVTLLYRCPSQDDVC